ncbi:hypothetical protein ACN47E_005983 [Coniothyrium glycines]
MTSPNTVQPCCLTSFQWDGTPCGSETSLANLPTYVVGTNSHAAVLIVHDALGWTFKNTRLLADHYAREANVTVYMPDFFGGERIDAEAIIAGRWKDLDLEGFRKRNAREIREPQIFAAATALREQGYRKIGAVGYCFGGWAVLRLAHSQNPLADCICVAHPSWTTAADFDHVGVPIQILAPEVDAMFSDDLKAYVFHKLVCEKKTVPTEYIHFPGVAHGCMTKGDENVKGEREAMAKGKDDTVRWFRLWLHGTQVEI